MNSLIARKKFPTLTEEEIAEIYANAPKSDEEIDYSDIPKMTKEELKKFKPARLREKKFKIAG